jgi:ABC-type multidrug transport system ATPase subunit
LLSLSLDFHFAIDRYSLMGSSGCGKTTLISTLVGIDELDSGNIEIFGQAPRENRSRIGYMPQQAALVEELKVREMIWFYGTIYGMSSDMIKDKIVFLCNLLELTDADKLVRDCSGGQKRRVSFAVSLIHDPELLILDEPTVGVDPMLRAKIWDYLQDITRTKNVTVLLSTHYTEEAKLSTHVGLMRKGVLVVQDKPHRVLKKLGVNHLDEAFVKLAIVQESDDNELQPIEPCQNDLYEASKNVDSSHKQLGFNILVALLIKNFLQIRRNPE